MRMFLVGMCDIFLILYLTSMGGVRPQTELTVDDYNLLKKTSLTTIAALKEERIKQAQLLAELDEKTSAAQRSELELKNRESEIALLKSAKLKSEEELRAQQSRISEREKALSLAEEQLSQLHAARKKLQLEKNSAIEQVELTEKKIAAKEAELLERQKNITLLTRSQAELKKGHAERILLLTTKAQEREKLLSAQMAEAQIHAEAALQRAQAAQSAAEASEQKSATALKRQLLAQQRAAESKSKAEIAQREAHLSQEKAKLAREAQELARKQAEQARRAAERAERARREADARSATLTKEMALINQNADDAYAKHLGPQKISIVARWEIIRKSAKAPITRTFSLVPVAFGSRVVVFMPLKRLGIASLAEYQAMKQRNLQWNGSELSLVYSNPRHPDIIAIAIPNAAGLKTARGRSSLKNKRPLMPTLLAVRNGVVTLDNSIRNVSEKYHVFKRDDLKRRGEIFYFDDKGFRGTGTFAEQIEIGDQIFDLSGTFVGLARTTNELVKIDSLNSWRAVRLVSHRSDAFYRAD